MGNRWHYDDESDESDEFPETASGRRARGQLEAAVDHLARAWMRNAAEEATMCTVEWLTARVIEKDGKPASSAAVARILTRWRDIDYAVIAENPIRFVTLTDKGFQHGLKELKRISDEAR